MITLSKNNNAIPITTTTQHNTTQNKQKQQGTARNSKGQQGSLQKTTDITVEKKKEAEDSTSKGGIHHIN